jgi:peptidyl-prolyl cis-trans isomerase D
MKAFAGRVQPMVENQKINRVQIDGETGICNVSTGITTGKKEAEELMRERDQLADIDFVKVDYAAYLQKKH